MKLAFDHHAFTMQKYGGISRYYFNLIKELIKKEDYEIAIFCGLYQNQYLTKLPKKNIIGLNIKKFPKYSKRFIYNLNNYFSKNSLYKWKPDILHETYYSNIRNNNKIKSKLIITTAYDMIHEKFSNLFPNSDVITENKKYSFRRADHIISISQNTKKDLIEIFGIDKNKISVVYPLFDKDSFKKKKIDKYFSSKPFLLYVGERGGYKNFYNFIEAFSKSKIRNDFDVVAFGGNNFNDFEKKKITSFGLSLSAINQVSGNDNLLTKYYQNANSLVFPSLYEGFGLPLLEAMYLGCPVIASNNSSMQEICQGAANYFDPYQIDSIINSLERVNLSNQYRFELINKGKKISSKFLLDNSVNKITKIYYKNLNKI